MSHTWDADNSTADSQARLRVLIADDHPLYRDALQHVVLGIYPRAEVIRRGTQVEVLDAVQGDDSFDLILLDLKLPGATGFTCLTKIREKTTVTPVVIVSAIEEAHTMRAAIEHGARGYLPKSSPGTTMRHALQLVMSGSVFMPASAVSEHWMRGATGQADTGGQPNSRLTERQQVVLRLMAEGFSNKAIANELSITEITVKAHVSAILRKLGVSNRVQAALLAQDVLREE